MRARAQNGPELKIPLPQLPELELEACSIHPALNGCSILAFPI